MPLNSAASHPLLCAGQGDYDDARGKYVEAMNTLGYQADLAYNIALCYYKQAQYGPALKHISDIIEVSATSISMHSSPNGGPKW
jgi:tetratricopeptide (TPR) repeat protein